MSALPCARLAVAAWLSLAALAAGGCGSILPNQATSYYLLQDQRADTPRQVMPPPARPTSGPAAPPMAQPAARPAARALKHAAPAAGSRRRPKTRAAAAAPPSAPAPPPSMLISVNPASTLYESAGIVFSRGPAERAYYQLGSWSERPSRRLGLMIEHRLVKAVAAGLPLTSVALDTSGVRGDWLLGVRLIELYHDTTTQPDRAVVTVEAELIDWGRRRMLDRAVFSSTSTLHSEQIDGAVAGLNEGLTKVLDQLEHWVDTKARSQPTPPDGPPIRP